MTATSHMIIYSRHNRARSDLSLVKKLKSTECIAQVEIGYCKGCLGQGDIHMPSQQTFDTRKYQVNQLVDHEQTCLN